MDAHTRDAPRESRVTAPLLIALGSLTILGPFGTDMFLPGLPVMARDLGVTTGQVLLCLSGFTFGLSLGQLFTGPLSDGIGRRTPLLIGTATVTAAAIASSLAPTLPILIGCCVAMGLGASFGRVISRAVLSDIAEGAQLTRAYALLGTLTALGPVLSPIVGVALLSLWGWRSMFLGMAALAGASFLLVLTIVAETRPPEDRIAHPFRSMPRNIGIAFRSPTYLSGAIVLWAGFAGGFAYIAASPFLVQTVLGLSPIGYAITFGVNGVGIILAGIVSARLATTWSARGLMKLGMTIQAVAAVIIVVVIIAGLVSPFTVLPAFFLIATSMGFLLGPATSFAIQGLRHVAGTALAVLGATQFAIAGVVSPLVGIGGDLDPVPFAVVLSLTVATGWIGLWLSSPARR